MAARLGVDIGGTFTDLVVVDERTGAVGVGKVLTTPKDPAHGVEQGIQSLLGEAGVAAGAVRALVHGTTLATNALIERKGARTALLTTAGFRDTLEIRTEGRYDMYDLFIDPPAPLVPRHLRREVSERLLPDGSVLRPLDEAAARREIEALTAEGVEALAICLLHAYVNPVHERRLAAIAREVAPELPVSCSSDVVPEIREYERTSTTAANVYVVPLMARYLQDLEQRMVDLGLPGQLYVMQSSGGIALPEEARRLPIRLVESGPAAGALAAALAARERGESRLLSFDMGGTTAKACVIDDGVPLVAREFEVARADRFKKGSGLPVRVPVIEMIEIGAGGGSIARVDRLGLLKVGPDSAGADPGPACYGLGGRLPTVTDADLVLGYLDGEFFLGGRMRLDRPAAARAIEEHVARPLGLDLTQAAWGIHRLVNENMAAAARIHGIERGKDLRAYPLFAFGGAGPVHCWQVAKILKVPRILLPFGAGAMSAYGLLAAPLAFDFVRTRHERLDAPDWPAINRLLEEMEMEGRARLARAGVAATRRACQARGRDALPRPGPRGGSRDARGPALAREPGADRRELRGRLPRALPPASTGRADRGPELARDDGRAGTGCHAAGGGGGRCRAPGVERHAARVVRGGRRLRRHAGLRSLRARPRGRVRRARHRRGARVDRDRRPGRPLPRGRGAHAGGRAMKLDPWIEL